MAMPLKNGVIVHLNEYANSYRADVYCVEGVWIFRINNTPYYAQHMGDADFIVSDADMWFDSHAMHGTLICTEFQCRITDKGKETLQHATD